MSLQNTAQQVSNGLAGIALVTPQMNQGYQPVNSAWSQQPPALMFHYEGEQSVELSSDITDHYIEDNTAIQDQISLKPEKITVHGFIGELNNVAPAGILAIAQSISRLTVISDFAPELSVTARNAYNAAYSAYQTGLSLSNSAVSAWGSITGGQGTNVIGSTGLGSTFDAETGVVANNQTKQQIMFQQFYGYWRARTLFRVQTPWAVFENMAIESIRASQDEQTRMITDFFVTFKMLRFANLAVESEKQFAERAVAQSSAAVELGTVNPSTSETSLADSIVGVTGE